MLMNIECSIVQSIKIALTFDDDKTKEREIAVGDLCYFEFNKNGKRKTIEGKVVKIGVSNAVDTSTWYIVVDGSLDFAGQQERFCPNHILDCEVIQKHDAQDTVATPNDNTHISSIRLNNGRFQVSIDGGYSWITPKNMRYPFTAEQELDDLILDEEYDEENHKRPRKVTKRPKMKRVIIECDDDDESDSDSSEDDSYEDDFYEDDDLVKE